MKGETTMADEKKSGLFQDDAFLDERPTKVIREAESSEGPTRPLGNNETLLVRERGEVPPSRAPTERGEPVPAYGAPVPQPEPSEFEVEYPTLWGAGVFADMSERYDVETQTYLARDCGRALRAAESLALGGDERNLEVMIGNVFEESLDTKATREKLEKADRDYFTLENQFHDYRGKAEKMIPAKQGVSGYISAGLVGVALTLAGVMGVESYNQSESKPQAPVIVEQIATEPVAVVAVVEDKPSPVPQDYTIAPESCFKISMNGVREVLTDLVNVGPEYAPFGRESVRGNYSVENGKPSSGQADVDLYSALAHGTDVRGSVNAALGKTKLPSQCAKEIGNGTVTFTYDPETNAIIAYQLP